MIIADTGPLVAGANERDTHHQRCAEFLERHADEILVPAPVVVEVCQILASRRGTRSEALFLMALGRAELRVVDLATTDYERAVELVQQYSNLPLGAVDAFVIAVAERIGATEIATLDHRHFAIVQPKHVTAFTLPAALSTQRGEPRPRPPRTHGRRVRHQPRGQDAHRLRSRRALLPRRPAGTTIGRGRTARAVRPFPQSGAGRPSRGLRPIQSFIANGHDTLPVRLNTSSTT